MRCAAVIAPLALACQAVAQPGATFCGLGGEFGSRAEAVSADGLVVVGSLLGSPQQAIRWTALSGTEPLGTLPGASSSSALAASADGSVIVGWSAGPSPSRAFRWTPSGGMCELLPVPGSMPGAFGTSALAVSADGRTAAGGSGQFAVRWTSTPKGRPLAPLSPLNWALAFGISGDGQAIVGGTAWNGRAFRWSQATGFLDLGALPFGQDSIAYAANADGWVIVGESAQRAFRWTKAGTMQAIGGPGLSAANAVNASGDVVVGTRYNFQTYRATIWTPTTGSLDIEAVLLAFAVMPDGWTLTDATGVSADGLTIVGVGRHDDGTTSRTEGWVVTLPYLP
ncbi:MAG: PEP-CTERM sorting domain-containing protein [Phycisphaerae bacterium]|nr:PEP-CTERM sorting domain-containing protein [Phycisphaerae bacterium]